MHAAFEFNNRYATSMQLDCRHVLPSSDKAREDLPSLSGTELALRLCTLQLHETTRNSDILAEAESSSSYFSYLGCKVGLETGRTKTDCVAPGVRLDVTLILFSYPSFHLCWWSGDKDVVRY